MARSGATRRPRPSARWRRTMSTVPGHDSLRDAGLLTPDPLSQDADARPAVPELDGAPVTTPDQARDGEEYRPADPEPGRSGDADAADVAEQAAAVPEGDDEYR